MNNLAASVVLALAASTVSVALAQSGDVISKPATIDCSIDGQHSTCSRADFLRSFAEAHTVALESQPKSRNTDAQLASFAKSVGKTVAPTAGSSDLTLRLVHNQPVGMSVGPSDTDLATLRVFSTRSGKLLWVETYRGQADLPGPAIIHSLIEQLQAALAGS